MNGNSPYRRLSFPTFVAWLAHNPTGIPRRHALGRVVVGILLGLLGGSLIGGAISLWGTPPVWALGLSIVGGMVCGATIGAAVVVILAYAIDRWALKDVELIGYSGVVRMLLHAGELSALGALSGGVGGAANGVLAGLVLGAVGGGLLGGVIYQVRGLGIALGLEVGLITGAIGGALGATIGRLGG